MLHHEFLTYLKILLLGDKTVLACSDWFWYYYMVMNPVDRIHTVWIQPGPDFAES